MHQISWNLTILFKITCKVEKTVCTESTETVPLEVCKYSYNQVTETGYGKTYEVTFKKKTDFELVTRCYPAYGYDHENYKSSGYGHKKHSSFKWKKQGMILLVIEVSKLFVHLDTYIEMKESGYLIFGPTSWV